jgi:sulfite exporter TauE/SafE
MHDSMLATLGLGFLLGLKHATEADHLAAVSTIVSERRSIWQSATVGVLWGAGHTASVLVAGFFVLVLGFAIPERVANILEFIVALMIIFLGMRLVRGHIHTHTHGGKRHVHFHFRDDNHVETAHSGLPGWRPVFVGMVHGLAGSAALTLLVVSQVARDGNTVLGLVYLLVFGAGSVGGMLVMSSLISLPFTSARPVLKRTLHPLQLLTGICSTAFGIVYAWETAQKLFLL